MTLVSVIIPAFNRVQLLYRSVSSALGQTHRGLEVIVVDDGSIEDVKGALSGFHDPRLSYHRRDENLGVSAARNHGISLSKGRYIAFLDSDDDWRDSKVEAQLARLRLKGPEYRVCYTRSARVDDVTGDVVGCSKYEKEGDPLDDLLYQTRMATSSLMVERDLLMSIHGFDERMHWGEDWDLYLRLAQHSPFAYVDEPLTRYHVHSQGQTSAKTEKNPVIAESLSILYQKHLDLFQKDRKARGKLLTTIGYYQASCGQTKAARRSFLRSILHDPLQKAAYISLARSIKGWE